MGPQLFYGRLQVLWEFRGGRERCTWASGIEKSPTRAGRKEDCRGGMGEGRGRGERSFQEKRTRGTKVSGQTKQHMQESLGSKQDGELGWRERAAGQPGHSQHRPGVKQT